jgi:hypothetical protein
MHDKEAIPIMLFMERHREGRKNKGATSIDSTIRKQFEINEVVRVEFDQEC